MPNTPAIGLRTPRLKPDGYNLTETRWFHNGKPVVSTLRYGDIKQSSNYYFVFIYPMLRLLSLWGSDVVITCVPERPNGVIACDLRCLVLTRWLTLN